jgi:hypothetical protein
MSDKYAPKDPDDGRHLLPALLEWVADQVPERMHLVWSDDYAGSGHPYRAVGGYNATFAIEWGRSAEPSGEGEGRPAEETEWSRHYPDHGFTVQHLDVLFHGGAIYRLTIALVDGARCWIPYPEPADDGYQVTEWRLAVVRLANDLVHESTDSYEYVQRAGIKTIKRPPP